MTCQLIRLTKMEEVHAQPSLVWLAILLSISKPDLRSPVRERTTCSWAQIFQTNRNQTALWLSQENFQNLGPKSFKLKNLSCNWIALRAGQPIGHQRIFYKVCVWEAHFVLPNVHVYIFNFFFFKAGIVEFGV